MISVDPGNKPRDIGRWQRFGTGLAAAACLVVSERLGTPQRWAQRSPGPVPSFAGDLCFMLTWSSRPVACICKARNRSVVARESQSRLTSPNSLSLAGISKVYIRGPMSVAAGLSTSVERYVVATFRRCSRVLAVTRNSNSGRSRAVSHHACVVAAPIHEAIWPSLGYKRLIAKPFCLPAVSPPEPALVTQRQKRGREFRHSQKAGLCNNIPPWAHRHSQWDEGWYRVT